ncbi:MAG: hypothetical protein GY862_00155 [Gammaproteobacteria bacterium]|nr:hypothetical protein [Gammaproteobacteria bacterium]
MNKFSLSISAKLGLTIFILAAACISAVMISYRGISVMEELGDLEIEIQKVSVDILTLRRHEKDFLARNDLKYASQFDERFSSLDTRLSDLIAKLRAKDIESDSAEELSINCSANTVKNSFP